MKLAEIVMRASEAVLHMKERGMLVDSKHMTNMYLSKIQEAQQLEKTLQAYVGNPSFNPRSKDHVPALLYGDFGLEPQYRRRKVKGGGYKRTLTGDDEAIMKVCGINEDPTTHEFSRRTGTDPTIYKIGATILECRRAGKLASTYFGLSLDDHSRYHPEWKMHGTETGRYSCHVHTYPPGKARSIFIAPPGHRLVVADLSQIELRIMWHLSQDPVGLSIMERGGDAHRETAAEIFGKAPSDVNGEERFQAKFINFGLPYGRGPESMADQHTTISLDTARSIFDRHHHRFSRLWEWMAINNLFSQKNKYIANPFGRRRYFIEQSDSERERQTQNMIPQSTAHDLLMQAHVDIHDNAKGVFPVFDHHDALGIEVPEKDLNGYAELIRTAFERERLPGLRTPCEIKIMQNWGEAKR